MEPTMPPVPASLPQDDISMYRFHEDRIQRLEADVGEIKTEVATISKGQEGMQNLFKTELGNLHTNIQTWLQPIAERVSEYAVSIKENEKKAGEALVKAEELHAVKRKRSERWAKMRAGVVTVLVAGAGVLVKEIAVAIWRAFTTG